MAVEREMHALTWPGEPRAIDQAVVLDKAEKHAGEHPMHGGLRQCVFTEGVESLGGVTQVAGFAPLGFQPS